MSTQSKPALLVADVMLAIGRCPVVSSTTILKEVMESMDEHRLGVVCVVGKDGGLGGILTEGDIRRLLLRVQKPLAAILTDDVGGYAVKNPQKTGPSTSLAEAVLLMGDKRVWDLPVVDSDNKFLGLLHLHQALLGVMPK
jgi:arabinose-5-phosphate isomerase